MDSSLTTYTQYIYIVSTCRFSKNSYLETALMIHHNIFMFRNYFAGASLTVMPIYHGKLNSKH